MGALSIMYNDEELTMKQAEQYLKSLDRNVRKDVWELIESRRKKDADTLDTIMSQLITIRRYDYTREQINQFHESIHIVITPIVQQFFIIRKKILGVESIKPYDFDAPLF
jgi:oligoendopeptidase F